ncbi:YbbR-like domain-containing protein [Zobellia amurskyensis]|uniref:YbbR-like domain-containing protein n=1 Tax=Zobellia amurskyensis TaxID=248905 RepID=A0A7X2ZRZ1_9FLAO|nr:YbbR-like domain-containing protein [Zobellia amurskyensis]
MINKVVDFIKKALKKRKVKIFLVFLFFSTLIWLINNLSRSYVSTANFDLEYVNVPEGYLFKGATDNELKVKLKAGGFQFLGFNFRHAKIAIDLADAKQKDSIFYIPQKVYRKQVERQLSASMSLVDIETDTLFVGMLAVISKKVPVIPNVEVNMARNYLLDGKMEVQPDSITITGPSKEIDSIEKVRTNKMKLPDLDTNFSETVEIFKPKELKNTMYSASEVELAAKIARFSEKVFEVTIKTVHFPNGIDVKTFPDKVGVVCKAKLDRLKKLEVSDFEVIADYGQLKDGNTDVLELELRKKPSGLHSVKLQQSSVEYILNKK